MNNVSILMLLLATVGSGLMCGLFYSFSDFIMKKALDYKALLVKKLISFIPMTPTGDNC